MLHRLTRNADAGSGWSHDSVNSVTQGAVLGVYSSDQALGTYSLFNVQHVVYLEDAKVQNGCYERIEVHGS